MMVATQSPAADERIRAAHRERTARLASRAAHYEVEAEAGSGAGGYIVRNPRVPGRSELVSIDGECSCRRGTVWGICKHIAAVDATRQATSWRILPGGKR